MTQALRRMGNALAAPQPGTWLGAVPWVGLVLLAAALGLSLCEPRTPGLHLSMAFSARQLLMGPAILGFLVHQVLGALWEVATDGRRDAAEAPCTGGGWTAGLDQTSGPPEWSAGSPHPAAGLRRTRRPGVDGACGGEASDSRAARTVCGVRTALVDSALASLHCAVAWLPVLLIPWFLGNVSAALTSRILLVGGVFGFTLRLLAAVARARVRAPVPVVWYLPMDLLLGLLVVAGLLVWDPACFGVLTALNPLAPVAPLFVPALAVPWTFDRWTDLAMTVPVFASLPVYLLAHLAVQAGCVVLLAAIQRRGRRRMPPSLTYSWTARRLLNRSPYELRREALTASCSGLALSK